MWEFELAAQGVSRPKNKAPEGLVSFGANYRTRTYDLLITNQLLYQLS